MLSGNADSRQRAHLQKIIRIHLVLRPRLRPSAPPPAIRLRRLLRRRRAALREAIRNKLQQRRLQDPRGGCRRCHGVCAPAAAARSRGCRLRAGGGPWRRAERLADDPLALPLAHRGVVERREAPGGGAPERRRRAVSRPLRQLLQNELRGGQNEWRRTVRRPLVANASEQDASQKRAEEEAEPEYMQWSFPTTAPHLATKEEKLELVRVIGAAANGAEELDARVRPCRGRHEG